MQFSLIDIPTRIYLGVPSEERAEEQEVLVSVFFTLDSTEAGETDELEKSLDYSVIYDLIVSFSDRHEPIKLLEKLHLLLKTDILNRFPEIEDLKVQIQKFPFSAGSVIISD